MTEPSETTPDADDDALPLGPRSLVWRYFGDNRMVLIGPRPAVLQNMLAELGQGRYGVGEQTMPADYTAFARYWQRMLDEIVVAHPTAKYGVGYVTKGFPCPSGVPPTVWRAVAVAFNPVAAFLTTGGLPPRARTLLGLPWSDRQERRYQRFAALCRSRPVNCLWDRLPMRLRYNGYARAGYARA